jgi:FkbM family methyltransferase
LGRFPLADGLFRRVVWSRIHFPEVEMHFLNALGRDSIDVALDVGAALGSYTWILNRKSRQVFAFEPGMPYGQILQRLTAGTRVRVVCAAVGSCRATVAMYTPGSDMHALHSATLSVGNPVVALGTTRAREVEQVSLDEFLDQNMDAGRRVDFLKVDVEGYELEVFKGARRLIDRHHPLIVCEIEQRHNAAYADIFRLLRTLGYRVYVFRQGGFQPFDGDAIEPLQSAQALQARLAGRYDPANNPYINNFVFQHPQSRIQVVR